MASFFDIQINGFAGVDFQKPQLTSVELRAAVDALIAHETPRFFLTLITDTIEALCQKLVSIETSISGDQGLQDAIEGYHIEGPWLSKEPGYRGAHNASKMCDPTVDDLQRLCDAASGRIRMLTIAPELAGAEAVIRAARAAGIHVSLGHTNATWDEISMAIDAGAGFATHLGNGTPLEMHRHNNIMQRLLARDELVAFLIPDGNHLPPFTLKNFFAAKPAGKVFFTTDCMAAAGAPEGVYSIGELQLNVGRDRVVRSAQTGTFAGSALTMPEAAVNVQTWLGLDAETARQLCGAGIEECLGL